MILVRFCLLLAVVISECNAKEPGIERFDLEVQAIYHEIELTLDKLQQDAGLQAAELAKMTAKIADSTTSYLTSQEANVQKEDVGKLFTALATQFSDNISYLHDLLNSVINLEEAEIGSAFILLDTLSKTFPSVIDKQVLYALLTAIEQTVSAIHDVAAESSSLFHYPNNPKVRRGRRETIAGGRIQHDP